MASSAMLYGKITSISVGTVATSSFGPLAMIEPLLVRSLRPSASGDLSKMPLA